MTTTERIAGKVIARMDREHPADALLRAELKAEKLPRAESRAVADVVFSFFRWRGWLDLNESVPSQLTKARELDFRFASDPDSFSTDELKRAVPDWISEELTITREWLLSLQTPPVLWLRAKRGTGPQLAEKLGESEREKGLLSDAVEYRGDEDLFRSPEFHAGEFEVQDVASQLVGLLCEPQPGETWWDACAGEGGKLLHLSDLMQNKGLIWASDRSERRLARLKQRAARTKAFNYRLASWDGSVKLPTKTKFDGVLIDAPCSGVGTWQRNPHARWTTTREDVKELAAIQQHLVLHAAASVKPGGKLIYSVCTLTRAETDGLADLCSPQLSGFAPHSLPAWPSEQPEASGRRWIWPQTCRGNGMFLSSWKRVS
ncbi:MAG TPA: RsmB/NOP family class I SAM-dependent RNA methyltransferase [Candidatus Limnocylindria bacterium]|nr:RsmB/NOP family class I SAM-dependent RNA methyltransferase [Candidatus Limnocylindria bacterium]